MLSLLKKIFGTAQSRQIQKYHHIVQKINQLEEHLQSLTDDQVRAKTQEFKERYQKGESLDALLPEAFAVVKNTCRRLVGTEIQVSGYTQTWNMVPYDVQLIGAIAMHHGCVAEMQTGEGKTLTAILPIYLNAITKKPVHLVTVNDYLARRDCQWDAPVLNWLNISCSPLTNDTPHSERAAIYQLDVVYGTASEFGFDYLRDNSMSMSKNEQVQRGYFYAIVDEIDSILIDEARTPLIISGPVPHSKQLYHELKENVALIIKNQRDICNGYATDAKKLLEKSGYEVRSDSEPVKLSKEQSALVDAAIEKLWVVSKGMPRNKVLKRILEDPELRERLDTLDIYYYGEVNKEAKAKTLKDLFVTVDEKASEYELTDKGISAWTERSEDDSYDEFTMLDLGPLYAEIENNEALSSDEKMQQKTALQEQDSKRKERSHNLRQMLRAHLLMEKDVDYIIQEDAIVIIDENTGRPQPGRRFSDGLHQAIEAKENLEIQKETQTYATITLQNYFRMYEKLAGMTGTALTEASEFKEIYKMDVLAIPTHVPCIRKDAHDEIYMTEREKYNAIIKEIQQVHAQKRPILIGTESVEISEKLSRILKANRLPHTVLNAKQHKQEAEIISKAGHVSSITIATNMAGRGTDIKLDPSIVEQGGLHVIATCRHQSRRIDRQLRGRCARQGDPGSSKFYVSFEDPLMRLFASPKLNLMIKKWRPPEGEAISAGILNKSIETAQKRIEQRNYTMRKYTIEYDNVINKQRQEIYRFRNEILNTEEAIEHIQDLLADVVGDQAHHCFNRKTSKGKWDTESLYQWLLEIFPVHFEKDDLEKFDSASELEAFLTQKISCALSEKMNAIRQGELENMPHLPSSQALNPILNQSAQNLIIETIDEHWQQHLLTIDYLRSEVSIRSVGNKDPLIEFKRESFRAFESMVHELNTAILTKIFKLKLSMHPHHASLQDMLSHLSFQTQRSLIPQMDSAMEGTQEEGRKGQTVVLEERTKRNEPCPCGSGKKHKKCCDMVSYPD